MKYLRVNFVKPVTIGAETLAAWTADKQRDWRCVERAPWLVFTQEGKPRMHLVPLANVTEVIAEEQPQVAPPRK